MLSIQINDKILIGTFRDFTLGDHFHHSSSTRQNVRILFGLVKLEPSTIDTPFFSGEDLDLPEDPALIQHEPNNIILFARKKCS